VWKTQVKIKIANPSKHRKNSWLPTAAGFEALSHAVQQTNRSKKLLVKKRQNLKN